MDYYEILGVARNASSAEIKKAYRKLSKEWHPDRHKGEKKSEEKYKQINRAYEVLSDSNKKQAYDQFGSEDGPQVGGGGSGFQGFEGFDVGGSGGLGDIFEQFFGGNRGRPRSVDMQGSDVSAQLKISLEEAYRGLSKRMSMKKVISCEECKGSGSKEGSKKMDCGECHGSGQVTRTAQSFFGVIQQSAMCTRCRGSGKVPEQPCRSCTGEGRVQGSEAVNIEIPAGISDGQTLRISGKGEAGRQGGPPGDLYVQVRVEHDARFDRQGSDLHIEVGISVADAVLGTEVKLHTFDGPLTVKIPAGTQPGQTLRIKSKGMPVLNAGRYGDLYVTVNVEVPRRIGKKERKLWEELKNS